MTRFLPPPAPTAYCDPDLKPASACGTVGLALTSGDPVAFNVRQHLTARRWDVERLDQAMADLGWGGAHWHATLATRHDVHPDPVTALHQLLDGERPLVTDEDYAMATALNVPRSHLHALPHPPRPHRRSRWARLIGIGR